MAASRFWIDVFLEKEELLLALGQEKQSILGNKE